MVEINNQRKAFLDMLAWLEELITDVRKPNHGYDVIVGGELFTDYSDHPRKLVTLNPNSSTNMDATASSVGGMPQAAWPERLLRKSGRCGIAADWGAWRFTYDWSWWYPWYRPLQQYLGLRRALVIGQFEHKADSLSKIQRSGRNGQEIDVWAESPRLSPLWFCIIVCLSWAVNHYRDNAITYKAQRDKNARELKLANATLTCRCVSVMLLRSMQHTKEVSWC